MSIAAMVASIKFNDRRNKREAFSHLSGKSNSKSQGIKIEPVSKEVLEEIRNKIQQQKKKEKRQLYAFCFIAIAFVLFLSYQVSGLSGDDASHFFRLFKRG